MTADNENLEGPYGRRDKSLRFDAIVITHWDSDHYEGVFGILQKGFEESLSLFGRGHYYTRATLANLTH
jgi:aromatic ring-opening dioxygenase LigB subunit